jgi:hypothetical protein
MKLPIAGGGRIPSRAPTHRDVEPARLASLGAELEDLAEQGPLTPDRLIEHAQDRGRPVSHYYAAAVLAAEVELPVAHAAQAVFCAGKCQSWGALDCIDRAAEVWERRRDAGQPLFDLLVRPCLDRCDRAAAGEIRGPHGTVVLTEARPDQVEEALAAALA